MELTVPSILALQMATIPVKTLGAPLDNATSIGFEPLPFLDFDEEVLGKKLIRHRTMQGYGYVETGPCSRWTALPHGPMKQ